MDRVYMLVNEEFVLGEFPSQADAMELRDFMSREHPEKRYWIVEDE